MGVRRRGSGRRRDDAGQPRGVRPVGPRASDAAGRVLTRPVGVAAGYAAARAVARGPDRCGRAGAPRGGRDGRRRGVGGGRAVHPVQPGLLADGGDGAGDGGRLSVVPAVLVHRRGARRLVHRPRRGDGGIGARRHPGHDDARLAAAGPQPRVAAVRAGDRDRAVHVGPAVPGAGAGAAWPPVPLAGPRPRPTPGAVRTLASMARELPGGFVDNVRSPHTRAAVETFLAIYSKPSLSWDDLATLRSRTRLPVLLKGVLHPDDAVRAVDLGVAGSLVSNHGGRQVDGAVGALDALVDVVAALGGAGSTSVPVILDSGVRSGADIVKALALGAAAVTVGTAARLRVGARRRCGGSGGAGEPRRRARPDPRADRYAVGLGAVAGGAAPGLRSGREGLAGS